jgi:F0F1-type ATP synthase assembly protein I
MGEPKSRTAKNLTSLVLIGSELVSPAIAGIVADQILGTIPWLTVMGTLGGACLAAWHGYVILTRLESRR